MGCLAPPGTLTWVALSSPHPLLCSRPVCDLVSRVWRQHWCTTHQISFWQEMQQTGWGNEGKFCSFSFFLFSFFFCWNSERSKMKTLLSGAKTDLLLLSLGENERREVGGRGVGSSIALHVSHYFASKSALLVLSLIHKAKRKPRPLISPTAAHC